MSVDTGQCTGGLAAEVVTSERWDAHVWEGCWHCSHYLLYVMVTACIFCYYNRPAFKKCMTASLNNFSLNMWLCSSCLLGEKLTLVFSLI